VTGPIIAGEEKLFHLHSFTFQLALVPPISHFGGYGPNTGVINENRTRFDALFETIKTNFQPFEPFDLVEPTFDYLHIPLERKGLADTKLPGFNFLLPSKLKRQNVQPLIRNVIFPYTHPSKEWFSSSSAWDTKNWIHAALALDPEEPQTRKANYRSEEQRVFLKSGIKAFWESQEDGGAGGDSLSLVLTIDCFVDLKKVWDPLPSIGHDLMGLIYHSLFPSSSKTAPTTESESRADSLRHFYACLRPAPPVPYSRSVQPSDMPSKLLPFQNRTVAWLLQRERAPASQAAEVCKDPAGFWSTHGLEKSGHLAYRRLTGELFKLDRGTVVPDRKGKGRAVDHLEVENGELKPKDRELLPTLLDLSQVKGSMLCEEMGKLSHFPTFRKKLTFQVSARQSKPLP
jgi:E3 ubiquitin-protein ligase SHPRH